MSGNRKFWKTIKSYFSNKVLSSTKYLVLEKDVLMTNEGEIAKNFNEYFINVTSKLESRHFPNNSNKLNTLDEFIELNFTLAFWKKKKKKKL